MGDFFEENKKSIITFIVIIVITLVIFIINLLMGSGNDKTKPEGILKQLGKDYYENYVYPAILNNDSAYANQKFSEYSLSGYKITARTLVSSYNDIDAEVFYRKGNYCDYLETYAMIYPYYPYGQNDYKIVTNVSCKNSLETNNDLKNESDKSDGGVGDTANTVN